MRSAWLILVLASAGCFSNGGQEALSTEPAESATLQAWGSSAKGCTGITLFPLVEFEQVAAYLPPGFRARDAQGILSDIVGAQVPGTGRVPVFIASIRCEDIENGTAAIGQGFVAIFVHAPQVAGLDADADYHFFEVIRYTDDPLVQDILDGIGWRSKEAAVEVSDPTLLPGGGAIATTAVSDGTDIYRLSVAAPAPLPASDPPGIGFQDWALQMWHTTPTGIGYIEYVFTLDVPLGIGGCTFRQGSVPAQVIDESRCPAVGADGHAGAVFPGLNYTGRIAHLAGAEAR